MKPLVSVIMNCFNGEKFLNVSIKSVLAQTYKNIELIFWDNLSTDNSAKIINSFKDKRIKYFKASKFTSLYEARNLAIKKAKGEFITFLDTDDWWHKNKIKKQFNLYKKKKGTAELIYSNCYLYKNKKKNLFKKRLPEGRITRELLSNYCVGLLTIFVKRKIFFKEKFNNKYNIIGDFDFIIRISKKINFASIQEPLAVYRVHKNNYSSKYLNEYISELKFWIKKNKIFFKNEGLSIKNQLILMYKLKIKKSLKFIQKLKYVLGV